MPTFRQELTQRVEQRLALLPRMLQSIEILQLATHDLLALIDRELEQNEVLEVEPAEPLVRAADEVVRHRAGGLDDEDPKLALLHAAPGRGEDVLSHVRHELALLDVSDRVAAKVLGLTERLDGKGYLTAGRAELETEIGADGLDEALAVLHSIEPRGLGAAGPIDAMLLQVDEDDPDRPLLAALLEEHLGALARNRLPDVADALELTVAEVEDLLRRVAALDSRPGARFSDSPVPIVRPDIVVHTVDGRSEVVVEDFSLPILDVSADYARMALDPGTPRDVRSYLKVKLRSARDLIQAVESRKRTLCAVGAAILAEQPEFLRRGRRAIRPLSMTAIAGRLGLHTSTVSRAVAGKYLGSDHGVIALRDFFDGARGEENGAAGRGRAAILELVREIVAAEDPRAPLSDDAITSRLAERGVRVARRTVAKHRGTLGIPAASLRRRFVDGSDGSDG